MAEPDTKDTSTKRLGIGLAVGLLALVVGWRVCSPADRAKQGPEDSTQTPTPSVTSSARKAVSERPGLSAPIAAAHVKGGEVIVAGLDLAAKVVRVQRLDGSDKVLGETTVLAGATWSNDADLKVSASPTDGIAITFRGLRGGKLVRQLVVLGPDLAPRGEPAEVAAASCATRDAVWLSDGTSAMSRPWTGAPTKIQLPKEEDAALLCGPNHAYAVLEGEERTAVVPLVTPAAAAPVTVMRESEFGDDEQRELSEYTVADDVGFVRLAGSGAVAVREMSGTTLGPLHKLKTLIPKDDDVVAVDASPKVLAIVYTQDVSSSCPSSTDNMVVSTKVMVLRVDRQTFEESTAELSPGRCAHEIGPFFTGAIGDNVSVAWVERTGGRGQPRAPIVGLAHVLVGSGGNPTLARMEEAADELVDAGCDGSGCFAAALAVRAGVDASVPGVVKVLRYNK